MLHLSTASKAFSMLFWHEDLEEKLTLVHVAVRTGIQRHFQTWIEEQGYYLPNLEPTDPSLPGSCIP